MSAITTNPFQETSLFSGRKLHMGITGSISAYKSCSLLRSFLRIGLQASATLTESATQFVSPLLFASLGASPVYGEMFSAQTPFDHLQPGRDAQAMLICPATANSLAKFAHGIADDMLSAQFLAFDGPRLLAPAMNPRMWQNEATQANVAQLQAYGREFVLPAFGQAACGEEGEGRLAELPQIFLSSLKLLSSKDMKGLRILITMGPTREYWDEVRYWSNPSSGKMGAALATAAWLRGALPLVICGPGVNIDVPAGVELIRVMSARQMHESAMNHWPYMDIGLFCAAVADFAPIGSKQGKFKKHGIERFTLEMGANPDILADCIAKKKDSQKILAFAAEIANSEEALRLLAKEKLSRKTVDLLAANEVGGQNSAFGSARANMLVIDSAGKEQIWVNQNKADIAWELLSWLLTI